MITDILTEKIIHRDAYLEHISRYYRAPIIKVLIGQRRVGKSTILKSVIQQLVGQKAIKTENIFYINKELFECDHIKQYDDLKAEFAIFMATTTVGRKFV
jgi:uncharacterized protein